LVGTVTDSPITSNDEGIIVSDFSAKRRYSDAYGLAYATVLFSGDELTATFDIDDENLWADATFDWTGTPPVADYTETLQFPLARVTENSFGNVLQLGCCSDAVAQNALMNATNYLQDATYAATSGNAARWMKDVEAAKKYLAQVYFFSQTAPAGS
jgi:hypothetical protein